MDMNIDRTINKIAKLQAKKAKMEYNLAAIQGQIYELQDKTNKQRNVLQSKLDVIEKSIPNAPTLREAMDKFTNHQTKEGEVGPSGVDGTVGCPTGDTTQ